MVPERGKKIVWENGRIHVPDDPIIPFIEGDGIGPDVWAATQAVLDAAIGKSYSGKRYIVWLEIFAGEKAQLLFNEWLPKQTVATISEYLVAIKGPLMTPVGGGVNIQPLMALSSENIQEDADGITADTRAAISLQELPESVWWWD